MSLPAASWWPEPDRQVERATSADGRVDVKSLDREGLAAFVHGMGRERWRALQVYKWAWQRGARSFHEMTNISKEARARLEETAALSWLESAGVLRSADGTRKYLWRLAGGSVVESVLIPDDRSGYALVEEPDPEKVNAPRLTLCVSSQVGCAMGCTFCLTGDLGLVRQLTPAEIAGQVQQVGLDVVADPPFPPPPGERARLTNLVLMGMGEPLHNIENLVVALRNVLDEDALGYSHRRVTVSTAGLVPGIQRLAELLPVNLAVSLNASTDEQRRRVMPVTRRWSLDALLECCRALPLPPGKRITFEYVMMAGFNDSLDDARRLVRLLDGVKAKVNLIPYNQNPDRDIRRPADESVRAFRDLLAARGVNCSIRTTRGTDISAACGQLGRGAAPREGENL